MRGAGGRLFAEDGPEDRVRPGRQVREALPETNWFRRNALLGDHRGSDAGLHDLLLHSRDRPYTVAELGGALERVGLEVVSFLEPGRYDARCVHLTCPGGDSA